MMLFDGRVGRLDRVRLSRSLICMLELEKNESINHIRYIIHANSNGLKPRDVNYSTEY